MLNANKIDNMVLTPPTNKNGNLNPHNSYKAAPTPGPNIYPKPKQVWVHDIIWASRPGKICIKMPKVELHAIAVPKPSINLNR